VTTPKHHHHHHVTVSLAKKGAPLKAGPPLKAGDKVGAFLVHVGDDGLCTVVGVDAHGNESDISAVATLSPPPSSSDSATISVDPPTGMAFKQHALGRVTAPGETVKVTATATWNDGSIGPFTFTLEEEVGPGTVSGIKINVTNVTVV